MNGFCRKEGRDETRDGEREEVTQELLEAAFQLRGWMDDGKEQLPSAE